LQYIFHCSLIILTTKLSLLSHFWMSLYNKIVFLFNLVSIFVFTLYFHLTNRLLKKRIRVFLRTFIFFYFFMKWNVMLGDIKQGRCSLQIYFYVTSQPPTWTNKLEKEIFLPFYFTSPFLLKKVANVRLMFNLWFFLVQLKRTKFELFNRFINFATIQIFNKKYSN
jgi:hypothetical protein